MRTSSASASVPLACLLGLLISGCAFSPTAAPPLPEPGLAIQGSVHGGQQPINGAHVYLFAANTTGYAGPGIAASTANASVSLLNVSVTGYSDAVGAYVPTNGNGNFTLPTGSYSCTPNTQVYLYSVGGDPGGGANSAASLAAALGNCPSAGNFATSVPFIPVNEVSTVAAAYAFAGFASDSTHVSSSSTALAQTGIANAFANATNLASLSTGVALATTPAGNGTVPQGEINTLANILAACVNSDGTINGPTNATACYTLFNSATSDGTSSGTLPVDTASAAINIAHNPAANLDALYRLPLPASPFAPTLSSKPNDFTVGIQFTGGGIAAPAWIAVDGSGDAWISNQIQPMYTSAVAAHPHDEQDPDDSVTELSSLGAAISPSAGYAGGGLDVPAFIAIDPIGNAWITNVDVSETITELANGGNPVSFYGFTSYQLYQVVGLAIDGSNNVWAVSEENNTLVEFNSTGAGRLYYNGYSIIGISTPTAAALDSVGNIWVANSGNGIVLKIPTSGNVDPDVPQFTGGGNDLYGIAIDGTGNVWVSNANNNSITQLSSSGSVLSGSGGFTGGGLNFPFGIAIDGAGTAWVANYHGGVSALSGAGVPISPSTGYVPQVSACVSIAVDGSGDVWVPNYYGGNVIELIGAATPVVTPISVGVASNMLGTRP